PALYYAAPVLLAVVAYAAWHFREKAPWLRQGLLFYAANIFVALPYYSVGAFELCADHYNYLAAVGIFYLLVSAWSAAQRAYPAAAGGIAWAGRLWAVALVVMSLIQIRYWKDTIAIVDNAIEKGFHQNGRMYEARAIAYANDRRDMNQAMRDFNKALEINPKLYDSYKYRGSLYGLSRQYEKSVADLDKYLESKPDDAEQYYNRGLSLLNLDRARDAIRDFNKTLEINPDFARAYRARGNAYLKIGDTAKADADLAEWERRNNGRR
ncbi:MAG: tetratricopeptide repeat protein, partial [Saprospiraceae bacterium]|nr:tetratricopeptide repeat protein [Saprospiraceae bacterium]